VNCLNYVLRAQRPDASGELDLSAPGILLALRNKYVLIRRLGNQNLLEVAAEVGTVKAFVYTSSGPIIAGNGGAYDHADENYPTLAVPVIRKGDPYHVAKAIGDKFVLEANGKNGIRTCTVRPTALYGEGDFQNVVPTMQALEDGNHKIWMGYNDIFMDVVYVGHVARLEVLAAKALLTGDDEVAGEAFNITDDQPAYPLNFFRKYWALAGDKTPLSSVWFVPPPVVLFLANSAEFITWATSWGKKRPKLLIKERMEFILYTRTYSIKKARERLGFKPWEGQPYANQAEAMKGSVEWYLLPENHGPVRIGGEYPSWRVE
jgi:sterol-4alpha-carboxylate 3-dehydrogenase (decarboxylating)